MRTRRLPAGGVDRARPSAMHSVTPVVWPRQGAALHCVVQPSAVRGHSPGRAVCNQPPSVLCIVCPRTARVRYDAHALALAG
eukprot:4782306-Pyramimonas_sp.AAC.1